MYPWSEPVAGHIVSTVRDYCWLHCIHGQRWLLDTLYPSSEIQQCVVSMVQDDCWSHCIHGQRWFLVTLYPSSEMIAGHIVSTVRAGWCSHCIRGQEAETGAEMGPGKETLSSISSDTLPPARSHLQVHP